MSNVYSGFSVVNFECSHTAQPTIYTQENGKAAVILGFTRLETGKVVLIFSLHLPLVVFRIYEDLEGVWFSRSISPD